MTTAHALHVIDVLLERREDGRQWSSSESAEFARAIAKVNAVTR